MILYIEKERQSKFVNDTIYDLIHVLRATVVASQEAAGWAWVLRDSDVHISAHYSLPAHNLTNE